MRVTGFARLKVASAIAVAVVLMLTPVMPANSEMAGQAQGTQQAAQSDLDKLLADSQLIGKTDDPECQGIARQEKSAWDGLRILRRIQDGAEDELFSTLRTVLPDIRRERLALQDQLLNFDTIEALSSATTTTPQEVRAANFMKARLAQMRRSVEDALKSLDQREQVELTKFKTTINNWNVADAKIPQATSALNEAKKKKWDCELAALTRQMGGMVTAPPSTQGGQTGTPSGIPASGASVTLTALDRSETVNLSFANGSWKITGRFRQGISIPSHDPNASDTTKRVTVDQAATAKVTFAGLPSGWEGWLGIGVDSQAGLGSKNSCGPTSASCSATSGPYPGVRRGLGEGWAAAEGVEVWLCRRGENCVGKTGPVATINVNWVLP